MNKKTEIQILKGTIKCLGEGSYTGVWLAEQLPFIMSAIKADLPPQTRALSVSDASAFIQQSNERCKMLLADAREESKKIIEAAMEESRQVRADAKRAAHAFLINLARQCQP